MFRDECKVRVYSYTLCSDIQDNSRTINGKVISKNKPYEIRHRDEKLEQWVRNENNPLGILKMKIYDPDDPSKYNILDNRRKYTSTELFSMSVDQIHDVCEAWDLDVIRKKKEKLIEILLNKFEEYVVVDTNDNMNTKDIIDNPDITESGFNSMEDIDNIDFDSDFDMNFDFDFDLGVNEINKNLDTIDVLSNDNNKFIDIKDIEDEEDNNKNYKIGL